METIGPSELLIILLVLVAIFGASRLPKMARGLGEGIREFRNGLRDASDPTPPDSGHAPDPETNGTATNGPANTGDARRPAS
jgi:sec-independent protein translocase protein TatA